MTGRVVLVRHPPVAKAWRGRCYGRSNMGWSREGAALARALTIQLAAERFDVIVHSGAMRTRMLAERLARITGQSLRMDARWLERDFGTWEGRTWDAIWRETGNEMDGMMTHPRDFRPGGGETGRDLADRVDAAWRALPGTGTTLVITHGGPIAAIRTLIAHQPLERMIDAVPPCGAIIRLPRDPSADDV